MVGQLPHLLLTVWPGAAGYAAAMRTGASLIRRLTTTNPLVGDVALAAAASVVSLLLTHERTPENGLWAPTDTTGQILIVLSSAPLVARRRAPVVTWALACAVWTVEMANGYWPVAASFGPLLCLYTVAAARPPRTIAVCTVLTCAGWGYSAVVDEINAVPALVGKVVVTAVLCALGLTHRELARRNERLATLTEQLRREQEERARRAVAEERVRIARELHDVVAHHMSVISVQAGLAGYVFDSDPGTARQALGTIATTSQEALEEMRRLLSVLRVDQRGEGGVPYDAVPGMARIGELAERVGAAGVQVEVRTSGEPRALAPGVELCAYRVIQEALTNVLKHAAPARAVVRVQYHPHQLVVVVTDDGAPAMPPRAADGLSSSGHGLIGMRERARLYGGTVTVGPRPEGGFEVRLTLPTSARAD